MNLNGFALSQKLGPGPRCPGRSYKRHTSRYRWSAEQHVLPGPGMCRHCVADEPFSLVSFPQELLESVHPISQVRIQTASSGLYHLRLALSYPKGGAVETQDWRLQLDPGDPERLR